MSVKAGSESEGRKDGTLVGGGAKGLTTLASKSVSLKVSFVYKTSCTHASYSPASFRCCLSRDSSSKLTSGCALAFFAASPGLAPMTFKKPH